MTSCEYSDDQVEQLAHICHEANRVFSASLGDHSIAPWEHASDHVKASVRSGVRFALSRPNVTPEHLHVNWCMDKYSAGWKYGEFKSEEDKTHPCLLPYDSLPESQRVKDELFRSIVLAYAG